MEDDGLGNQFFLNMSGLLDALCVQADRELQKSTAGMPLTRKKRAERLKEIRRPTVGGTGTSDPDIEPEEGALLGRKNRGERRNQNKQDNLLNPDDEDYL